ncbi:MAG: hypothetical protein AAB515_00385 [Patescibacteria group bacterium]
MRSLEETLNYKNDRVLNKFRVMYAVSLPEAQEIALEALKWLWLNARLKQDRSQNLEGIPRILVIHLGMVIVDEYWHTFVLHTRDYEQFCKEYLGTFIHHSPGVPDFHPPSREETELQLNYICEVVGEDTMIRWYEEYPVRYSAAVLAKLQKPRLFDQPCEAVHHES